MRNLIVALLAVALLTACGPVCMKHQTSNGAEQSEVANSRARFDTKAIEGLFAAQFEGGSGSAVGEKQSK